MTPRSVKEYARRWGLSERHVRNLISRGVLPVRRFGRVVRILDYDDEEPRGPREAEQRAAQ